MIKITNLCANILLENKPILNGVTMEVAENEVVALMGKNGSGKSTLSHVLMGNPLFKVTSGNIDFNGKDLLKMSPEERSLNGLFLSFQHPSELEGVNVGSYLRLIYNKHHAQNLSPIKFREAIKDKLKLLQIDETFLSRYLNDGFSGGEKKKMEMLQMLIIEPTFVILDEVDSGLDVDALKVVSEAVNYLIQTKKSSILLITHYARILKYVVPNKVLVMEAGKIVQEGTKELAFEIEEKGYINE